MTFTPSPLEKHHFKDELFYIKRDDLLDIDFSGNKARKFEYFLVNDFPKIKQIVGFGSNQSNAMYSLSVLAKMKGWKFIYFCDHIPSFLRDNPVGNYKYALANGMELRLSNDKNTDANSLNDDKTIVVQEGGRQIEAKLGLKNLALELIVDIKKENIKNPYIFLPSGTGTTALFLQKYLPFKVFTCSTVGDDLYLRAQWDMVDKNMLEYPSILNSKKKYHYGKLYPEAYQLWKDLKDDMGVEFDLLYDPIGWIKFLENKERLKGTPIYIHQGGLKGNESMKARYERKYDKIL